MPSPVRGLVTSLPGPGPGPVRRCRGPGTGRGGAFRQPTTRIPTSGSSVSDANASTRPVTALSLSRFGVGRCMASSSASISVFSPSSPPGDEAGPRPITAWRAAATRSRGLSSSDDMAEAAGSADPQPQDLRITTDDATECRPGAALPAHLAQCQSPGQLAQLLDVHVHGGQGGLAAAGFQGIVEPDHGYLPGNLDPGVSKGFRSARWRCCRWPPPPPLQWSPAPGTAGPGSGRRLPCCRQR